MVTGREPKMQNWNWFPKLQNRWPGTFIYFSHVFFYFANMYALALYVVISCVLHKTSFDFQFNVSMYV